MYDFFVFPADRADDVDGALSVYESSLQRGAPTPGGPVAGFLADLPDAGLVGAEAAGNDAGANVATSWDDPMANLRTVAGVAAAHGLSVLDVQLGALYDPRQAVEVSLETQGGPRLTFTTRRILAEVVAHIREGRYRWVTLTREADVFAQTFHDDDGSWALEHREGPGLHFLARTDDAVLVERLLWSWARDDGRWQAMIGFSPVRL